MSTILSAVTVLASVMNTAPPPDIRADASDLEYTSKFVLAVATFSKSLKLEAIVSLRASTLSARVFSTSTAASA